MALFTAQDLEESEALDPEAPPEDRALCTETDDRGIVIPWMTRARLAELMPAQKVRDGQTWHVISAASWNSYDLICYLAELTGPAHLWICTWSISHIGIQRMIDLKARGAVKTITALVNPKTLLMKPAEGAALRDHADRFGVYANHGKVYILDGERLAVSIVSSANLTANPRLEAATVTTGRKVAAFHKSWITAALDRSAPFEYQEEVTMEPADVETIKRLYLVRGLPGTGKTTLARMISPATAYSLDDYFEDGDRYRFDPSQLTKAAEACEARTQRALELGVSPVAVGNTFSTRAELEPFRKLAAKHGYKVAVIECQTVFGNVHGVPADAVSKMADRWEPAE